MDEVRVKWVIMTPGRAAGEGSRSGRRSEHHGVPQLSISHQTKPLWILLREQRERVWLFIQLYVPNEVNIVGTPHQN